MKGWTIHLPRRRCPVCGAELECAFNGKFTIKGRMSRKDAKERGEYREGLSGGVAHDDNGGD